MKYNKILLLFSISMVICLSGCKKKGTVDDLTAVRLHRIVINNPKHPKEARQLAERAVLLWDNDKVDSEPVLIEAVISSSKEKNDKYLGVIYYDEDKDLLGIIVEERPRSNDDVVLIEKYPIYNDESCPYVVDVVGTEITLRAKGVLKDEKLWDEFSSSELSETLMAPPVLISLPSEEIDVYITLYDRQGNQSNKVKLIDVTSYSGEK